MSRAAACVPLLMTMAVLSAPRPGGAQAAATVHFLEDAAAIPVALQKAIPGKVGVYKLTLYDDYAIVDIQDSQKKENIDRYTYRDGAFGKGVPVTMRGSYTQKALDAAVFPLESIDFSLVPKMIADARQLLAMPDGKTDAVFLDIPRAQEKPSWHVGVTDDRHHGAVTYDLKGRKLSTFKK